MSLELVIGYLRDQQLANGSFQGFASPSQATFGEVRKQASIFPTMLILDCLHDVVGAEDIRLRAATYIEQQVSKQGSWNYWDMNSPARKQEPYPDDLDDTACAMAALTRADAKWVTGFRLGQFTRLLVSAETKPGGPYNTWLVDGQATPQWRRVDVTVNANIGYTLSLHSVQVAGLTSYIDEALQTNALRSEYYVGVEPTLYFISRWHNNDRLRTRLTEAIAEQDEKNALQQALLLSAGCNIGLTKRQLENLAYSLQSMLVDNRWRAEALYVDPSYEGVQHYGGSATLTTAFALQALTAYARISTERSIVIARKRGVPQLMKHINQDAHSITNVQLRRRYVEALRSMMNDTAGDQISAPATLIARAGGWNIPQATLDTLNAASLNGWAAYTIQDDMLDGEADVEKIPLANVAYRRSYQKFLEAVPSCAEWPAYVTKVFDLIDGANQWERRHAWVQVVDKAVRLRKLPDYSNYSQLAERSLGHSLAATAVAVTHFESLEHPQVQAVQMFFNHFLIARQLNDDAHDWEDDLRNGRLTAVTALLLQGMYKLPHTLIVDDDIDALRQRFWEHTIGDVAALVRVHLQAAQKILDTLLIDTDVLASWLDTLEASVAAAMHGQKETRQFLRAYEASHA